jgi:hypothetical protein
MKTEMPDEIWVRPTHGDGKHFSCAGQQDRYNRTKYVRADIAQNAMKCFYEETELPKVFIAIYSDLSGADIFGNHDDGFYSPSRDLNVPDNHWFIDAGYLWFIALPDDFNVFGGE